MPNNESGNGLEGVVAVTTAIGKVDGERGELVVRGERMEEYAPTHSYTDVMQLLWEPDSGAVDVGSLGARRQYAFGRLSETGLRPGYDAMDFLRFSLSMLEPKEAADSALDAAAMLAVAAPAWARLERREALVPPDPELTQPADFLRMLGGVPPADDVARALETYLVTVTDHGMNASTFTARVIASTQSDLLSALAGAIGALKGPLHGGAPGPVLDMLDEIGEPDRAEGWIRAKVAAGERIMGMGHRVYRVRDPRAEIFEKALTKLHRSVPSPRLQLARAVEQTAERVLSELKPGRALKANVEFYTAVLLEAVGIPRELFTPTFAVGRNLGWSAHVMEQQRVGRLIRPRSAYTGLVPT